MRAFRKLNYNCFNQLHIKFTYKGAMHLNRLLWVATLILLFQLLYLSFNKTTEIIYSGLMHSSLNFIKYYFNSKIILLQLKIRGKLSKCCIEINREDEILKRFINISFKKIMFLSISFKILYSFYLFKHR